MQAALYGKTHKHNLLFNCNNTPQDKIKTRKRKAPIDDG